MTTWVSFLGSEGQSAEQIVCLDLAANECGLEEVDNGPGNNGYSFCAGTSGGPSVGKRRLTLVMEEELTRWHKSTRHTNILDNCQ